jgi:hypothetical protein
MPHFIKFGQKIIGHPLNCLKYITLEWDAL